MRAICRENDFPEMPRGLCPHEPLIRACRGTKHDGPSRGQSVTPDLRSLRDLSPITAPAGTAAQLLHPVELLILEAGHDCPGLVADPWLVRIKNLRRRREPRLGGRSRFDDRLRPDM